MFANLEALLGLVEHGTISRAAARLGLTQSAVSKRIQSLEQELGKKLLQAEGRGVELTPFAQQLVRRVETPFLDLKEALSEEVSENRGQVVLAMSGAILLSWGSRVLKKVRRENPQITLNIGANRSPIAVARVRSGECMAAMIHGTAELSPDLSAQYICDETFVIVPSELKPLKFPRKKQKLDLLTIEAHSETWSFLERKLRLGNKNWGLDLHVQKQMQNFMSVAQLARAGFAHGLAPLGVPLALGISEKKLTHFPGKGIQVPISLVGRRSMLARPIMQQFLHSFRSNLPNNL